MGEQTTPQITPMELATYQRNANSPSPLHGRQGITKHPPNELQRQQMKEGKQKLCEGQLRRNTAQHST